MKSTKLHVIRLTAEDVAKLVELLTLYTTAMPDVLCHSKSDMKRLKDHILTQASKGPRK